jgi:hypothetical protein
MKKIAGINDTSGYIFGFLKIIFNLKILIHTV